MKILFYINDLRSGGKERRLVELIKGLSSFPEIKMGIVLTRDIIHYQDIFSENIQIYYTFRKSMKKDPRVFYQFYKIAKKYKPDIIHVWGNLVATYAIPAKVFLKIPMINNQITGAPLNVSNSLLSHKLTFPFSDKIIANTYAGLKAYNAPRRKSSVIYNGFDFSRIEQLEEEIKVRKRFNIKTKFVIGMVASFSDKKDYQTYIKGANKVLDKVKDVTFLCIGAGDYGKFKKMIHKNNKDKILFLGRQTNVESIMNICDIGVLISDKFQGEGISNALLEFMALRKPVIASNNGGNLELVHNKRNGFIIERGSLELKNKILLLLNNNKLRHDFGKVSEQIVIDNFTIDKMINSFMREYKIIIKNHN